MTAEAPGRAAGSPSSLDAVRANLSVVARGRQDHFHADFAQSLNPCPRGTHDSLNPSETLFRGDSCGSDQDAAPLAATASLSRASCSTAPGARWRERKCSWSARPARRARRGRRRSARSGRSGPRRARSRARRHPGRPGRRDGVAVGDLDEDRAGQPVGLATRTVEPRAQADPRGDLVAPCSGRRSPGSPARRRGCSSRRSCPAGRRAGIVTGGAPRRAPARSRSPARVQRASCPGPA